MSDSFLAPLAWGETHGLTEAVREVVGVAEAAQLGDSGEREVGVARECPRFGYALADGLK